MADIDVARLLALTNIAEELDSEMLDDIGRTVVKGYELDEQSRVEYLERNEDWMKLATQLKEVKSTPWPNAANVKYPLLTTAAVQFSSRAYPALVKYPNTVKGRVVGKDTDGAKLESSKRIAGHMNWQIFEQMEEWEEDMDKLTIILPISGTVFKKTYFNPIKGRNVSTLVLAKDLAINYYASSLETAIRKTHILEMTTNDLHERVASGLFLEVELVPVSIDNSRKETSNKIQGTTPPNDDRDNVPRIILEQHTVLDLDDDGYKEPYIVTVDLVTKKVLRIVARYDVEGITTNDDGDIVRIEPVEYFTKFGFIPNPDGGIYDLGFGVLLGSLNETANTLINQLLDSGTLNNQQNGYISRGLRLKGGTSKFKPFEWKVVNASGDDIRKGILPLPIKEPSNVLFLLLGTILDSGKELASVMDILVGQNPGQNQPASTTMAVIEQGLKVFTAIHKRSYRSLKKEFKKLYRLNKIHLDQEEYYEVLDNDEASAEVVFSTDYGDGIANVIPAADPSITTETQKLIKAQALLELLPLGLNVEEVKRRNLEAQEQPNIDVLLQVEDEGPPFEQVLEESKFKHQVEKDTEELEIRWEEVRSSSVKNEAAAMLAIAKAQSEETNATLNDLKLQLDAIRTFLDHEQRQREAKEEQEAAQETAAIQETPAV